MSNGANSPQNKNTSSAKNKSIAALILGIAAIVLPVPILDLAAGIVGIVLSVQSKNDGFTGGLRIAGFVLSIIGTIAAASYTLDWLTGGRIYGGWGWF